MFGRKYRWIVLISSLVSVMCLLVGEAHFSGLAAERGRNLGSAWILWAVVPGAFGTAIWLFQRQDWLQLAGVLSTAGALVYSVFFVLIALSTERLGGHSLLLPGYAHFVLILAWSVLAMPIGWFGARDDSRDQSLS